MSDTLVALSMPRGSSAIRCADAADSFYRCSHRGVPRIPLRTATSLAIRCFNMLWCDALNARRQHHVTHFAMQHDDVCPDAGWLDAMLDELDRCGADMLSAVVPIKNPTGVTSTAVSFGDQWIRRRLTMREVFTLPETFTLDDIPWNGPDKALLVNTGLWVCRFDAPWVERVAFNDHARIVQAPDGTWCAQDVSEDWDWSRQMNELGLKLAVTRKVPLYHERKEFTTREPWGAWECDEGYFKYAREWEKVVA